MEKPLKPVFTDEQRAFFRACAAQRRREDRNCVVCGAPMGAVVGKRRYCSPRCAQRAYRQRQSARAAAE